MREKLGRIAMFTMASAMVLNAAVISLGPPVNDDVAGPAAGGLPAGPWSFELPFTLDLTLPGSTMSYSGNWSAVISDSVLGPFHVVLLEGWHATAPHAGEVAPGPTFFGGVLFPMTPGAAGTAFGVLPHGGHEDQWLLTVTVDRGGTTASGTVKAWHDIPEPSTYALVGGLGLMAFAAYRRTRS